MRENWREEIVLMCAWKFSLWTITYTNKKCNCIDDNKQHGMKKLIKHFLHFTLFIFYTLACVCSNFGCFYSLSCIYMLISFDVLETELSWGKILRKEKRFFQSFPQMSFVCFGIRRWFWTRPAFLRIFFVS